MIRGRIDREVKNTPIGDIFLIGSDDKVGFGESAYLGFAQTATKLSFGIKENMIDISGTLQAVTPAQ